MNNEKVKGVDNITGYINGEVIPNAQTPISVDTVRRQLKRYECGSNGLVCEHRQHEKMDFETCQTSLDALFDSCDIEGITNIADYCVKSERWVKDKIKNDSDFPDYKLFGRHYSTQESLTNYMQHHFQKPEKWKPSKREVERLGIVWSIL